MNGLTLFPTILAQTACMTGALWEATNPNERIGIPYADISEEELKSRGVSYKRYDEGNMFLVEKTTMQKFRDYTYRAVGTPVTVTLDAASAVVVVVGLMVADSSESSDVFSENYPDNR
jgi:hypothetical protein